MNRVQCVMCIVMRYAHYSSIILGYVLHIRGCMASESKNKKYWSYMLRIGSNETRKLLSPGFEPGLLRPQRNDLTPR